jgi:hypothetical protein
MNIPFTLIGTRAALLLATVTATSAITPAFAFDLSDGRNWGEAIETSTPLGEHSSSFTGEPRQGLGNLAQDTGSWCDLLSALGSPC